MQTFVQNGKKQLQQILQKYKKTSLLLGLVLGFYLGHVLGFWRLPWQSIGVLDALPANTPIILSMEAGDTTLAWLPEQTRYGSSLLQLPPLFRLREELKLLDGLFQPHYDYRREALACGLQTGQQQDFAWLFSFGPLEPKVWEVLLEKLRLFKLRQTLYRSCQIYDIQLEGGQTWVFCYHRGLLLASTQSALVEAGVHQLDHFRRNLNQDPAFYRLAKLQDQRQSWKFYLNAKTLSLLSNQVIKTEFQDLSAKLEHLGSWLGGYVQWEQDNWTLQGQWQPNRAGFWAAMAQEPEATKVESQMGKFLPDNLALLARFRWTNPKAFAQKLGTWEGGGDFAEYVLPWFQGELSLFVTEPTQNNWKPDRFALVRCRDTAALKKSLAELGERKGILQRGTYQSFDYVRLPLQFPFSPLFPEVQTDGLEQPYCLQVEDYVLFCNSEAVLKLWIEKYNFGRTFDKLPNLQAFARKAEQAGQVYLLIQNMNALGLLNHLLQRDLTAATGLALGHLSPLGLSLRSQGRYFHLILTGAYAELGQKKQAQTQVAWRYELGGKVLGELALLEDEDKNKLILAHDATQRVYALDASGLLRWKVDLDGPMLSTKVLGLDYYGGGVHQAVFNTANTVYVVNLKDGKILKQLKLAHAAVGGLSVLDYGHGSRLFVPCRGGQLFGFDPKGKPLTGWNPLNLANVEPLVLLQNSKDEYLMALTKNGLSAYGRDASRHFGPIAVEQARDLSLDLLGERVVACSPNGRIQLVNLQGKHFSLAAPSGFKVEEGCKFALGDVYGTEKADFVRASGNRVWLHAYDEQQKVKEVWQRGFDWKIEHLAVFTRPFKAIGLVSVQRQSIYLLNPATGETLTGFPLVGTTPFLLWDLMGEGQMVLLVGNRQEVYAYKVKGLD